MKKIIVNLIAIFLLTIISSQIVFSQTTVIFKPNATVGKDANILTSSVANYGDLNYNNEVIKVNVWTANGGIMRERSLIKFEELSTIPTGAVITDVKLKFYGGNTLYPEGNNVYPGGALSQYSNSTYLQRVTSAWDESTVTWNTQPTTTNVGQISIPSSTSQYNWDYIIENSNILNAWVQDMVSNPNTNNGFMLRLMTEETYRRLIFASSDNADSTLWPELQVTYLYNDTCNSDFSYTMASALDPATLTFNAKVDAGQHIWRYGNQSLSTASSFSHTFTPSNLCQELSHEVIGPNGNCSTSVNIYICNSILDTASINEVNPNDNVDVIIHPNPSKDFWNISINSKEKIRAEIIIRDALGKVVLRDEKSIYIGENNIPINGKDLIKGLYVIEIKGKGINYAQKLIKQ